jgi:hypothetical protein
VFKALSEKMKITNKFSWSPARYNLFNFCEKAYYFRYYESWNGWDTYAPQEAKTAFRLKHLIPKELWLDSILKRTLIETINHNPRSLLSSKFKRNAQKFLSFDIRSLCLKEWKDDPKKICIREIYYNESSTEKIISRCKDEINKESVMLQNSKLFQELSKLPYSAFHITHKPLSFMIDNIPIWCSPDLTWDFLGKKHFLSLNKSNNWALKAGLNVLYAEQKWRYPSKNIICHTVFMDEDNCFSVYAVKSPKEIKKIILKSSREMQTRLTFSSKAYIENFPKTSNSEKCKTCSFKKICFP